MRSSIIDSRLPLKKILSSFPSYDFLKSTDKFTGLAPQANTFGVTLARHYTPKVRNKPLECKQTSLFRSLEVLPFTFSLQLAKIRSSSQFMLSRNGFSFSVSAQSECWIRS